MMNSLLNYRYLYPTAVTTKIKDKIDHNSIFMGISSEKKMQNTFICITEKIKR